MSELDRDLAQAEDIDELNRSRPRRRYDVSPLERPAASAGDLTHGEDTGHTARLMRALGHDPEDAR